MTGAADLDRTIVAWLREGEATAPARLAAEVRRAIDAAPPRRNTFSLGPIVSGWSRRRLVALFAIAAALMVAMFALLSSAGSHAPLSSVASPSAAPSHADPTDTPDVIPTATQVPVAPPTDGPPPTRPPAGTWTLPGIALDLPPGWSDAPRGVELAVIGALDQIGDPYAGVWNMVLHPIGPRQGPMRFHSSESAVMADAGINVHTSGIQEQTPALEADRLQASLKGLGYTVGRTTVKVQAGQAVVLDWDVQYNGPAVHYRAYIFKLGGSVQRIDFATLGAPGRALAQQLLEIVRSARPA
jgi:hypothetical protein